MTRRKLNIIVYLLAAVSIITPSYLSLESNTNQSENSLITGPILSYHPTSHDFGYVEEGELYYTNFHIWNSGNGTLFWNLTSSHPWILSHPTTGSSTGEHTIITVQINTLGMSSGPHNGNITINSNDATSMNVFNISLTINTPPNTPSKPVGPSNGTVGTWYPYSTSTVDPDGDYVQYGLDAHYDGIVTYWSPYYPSGGTYTLYIMFESAGTYYLRFKARDIHEAESNFSQAKKVVISGENHAPETPLVPTGPSTGTVGTSYSFTTNTTDPDGDKIRYGWDWTGNDIVDEWTGFYDSGTPVILSHTYLSAGTYQLKVVAEDEHGAKSGFSPPKTIVITENNPPNKPSTPIGPRYGRIGVSYSYSSSAIHPDGYDIEYLFDWGDGTTSGWIGPYNSGDYVSVSHTWTSRGTFPIKVQARCAIYGTESVWSNSLPVSMPKGFELFTVNHRILDLYQTILDLIQSFSQN